MSSGLAMMDGRKALGCFMVAPLNSKRDHCTGAIGSGRHDGVGRWAAAGRGPGLGETGHCNGRSHSAATGESWRWAATRADRCFRRSLVAGRALAVLFPRCEDFPPKPGLSGATPWGQARPTGAGGCEEVGTFSSGVAAEEGRWSGACVCRGARQSIPSLCGVGDLRSGRVVGPGAPVRRPGHNEAQRVRLPPPTRGTLLCASASVSYATNTARRDADKCRAWRA